MQTLFSGGLRYAPTTGYYLTALQAQIRSRILSEVVIQSHI
jgi:hypothetical protein